MARFMFSEAFTCSTATAASKLCEEGPAAPKRFNGYAVHRLEFGHQS